MGGGAGREAREGGAAVVVTAAAAAGAEAEAEAEAALPAKPMVPLALALPVAALQALPLLPGRPSASGYFVRPTRCGMRARATLAARPEILSLCLHMAPTAANKRI